MNWSTVRTAVEAWLKTVLGSDWIVAWDGHPSSNQWIGAGKRIRCKFRTSGKLSGRDDIFYEYDALNPVGEEIDVRISGQRRCILTMNLEVFSSTAGADSYYHAEKLQDNFSFPSAINTFTALGFGIEKTESLIDLSAQTVNNRVVSTSILEISMYYAVNENDSPVTIIEQMEYEATFTKPDSSDIIITGTMDWS